MRYFLSRTSIKYLQKLETKIQTKIISAIENLPDKGNIRPLLGKKVKNIYRLRLGAFRIVFKKELDAIKVIKIDTRGDVYK